MRLPLPPMKILFIILVCIHGLLHLVGFLKGIRLKDFPQIKTPISGIQGVLWFFAHLILMVSLVFFYTNKPYWWIPAIPGVLLSQALIFSIWKDAKWGTLINLFILAYAAVGYGKMNFDEAYVKQVDDFYKATRISGKKGLSDEQLINLPYPVKNWIAKSGVMSKDQIVTCRIIQTGEMKSDPKMEKGIACISEQYFNISEPGFIWKADLNYGKILPVIALDSWSEGKAQMNVETMYLFQLANHSGEKIDEGSMQRFLAEMVWFPSAAASNLITWKGIDSLNAEATFNYRGKSVNGIFSFNKNGDFVKFSTLRYQENDKKLPWVVEATAHSTMNGVRIPIDLKVSWKLPEGDFTWFTLHVNRIEYNLPYRF